MGSNARKDAIVATVAALGTVLQRQGIAVSVDRGVDAALAVYESQPQTRSE